MKQILLGLCVFFVSCTLFAQSKGEPVWWKMERDGKFLEVASHLLYKVQSDSTRNHHADYLHIARNYGYLNDYEKAIFYWKKSYDPSSKGDKQFEWYHKGTLAFFKRDKKSLKAYYSKLKNNHSQYYESNYQTLKSLYENFEKGYLDASKWKNK